MRNKTSETLTRKAFLLGVFTGAALLGLAWPGGRPWWDYVAIAVILCMGVAIRFQLIHDAEQITRDIHDERQSLGEMTLELARVEFRLEQKGGDDAD